MNPPQFAIARPGFYTDAVAPRISFGHARPYIQAIKNRYAVWLSEHQGMGA